MPDVSRPIARVLAIAALIGAVVVGMAVMRPASAFPADKRVVPPPAQDESAGSATSEVAVLAGGCFWGVQGVYQHVKGVTNALSGYAGGQSRTAHYEIVSEGGTSHAESVRVTFDPQQISYGKILQIFFTVVHDPTTLNRQGPDVGPQYRSAIFPLNAAQADIARAYIAQLNQAKVFRAAVVTTIEMDRPFYAAEDYHQDFMRDNPDNPYIMFNDLPKIGDLKRAFPDLYRNNPVLVRGTR